MANYISTIGFLSVISPLFISGCSFLIGEKPVLTPVNGKMCPVNPRFKYDQENHYENKKLVLVREENKEHGLYHYKYTECGYSYVDFDRGDLRYYIYNTMPLYMFDNIQFNGIHGGDSGYGRME